MAPNNNNKKNNKKNRNKNKKASGAGGNHNHNHNQIHNNSTIPATLATATAAPAVTPAMTLSTSLVTTEYINKFNKAFGLTDYPKSTHYAVGVYQQFVAKTDDLAMASFIRGAKNDSCVGCMYLGGHLQSKRNNMHLSLPLALEGMICGHMSSIDMLICECYKKSKPYIPLALISFLVKMTNEFKGDTNNEEIRKDAKKDVANICFVCEKEDSKDKAFEKCGICKYYSYCGKDCQTYHWKEQNHIAECRHLKILREYCKPRHVKEIRDAIIDGVDPKTINRLQLLRTNLGLNRPKEEYEELLLHLGDDSNIQDRYKYLTARKDGTVHIGFTPEEM